ncbi:Cysteine, histidine-dependent amidohydrolase/peptidase [Akanthomyces lecanii RCEF 1005]|uniref:Cysteine, histidine-dependent amidohydrolase/peptidase n=1 Tax=Akanthomyces lecanii RCEF 1005 TaxID=1081108 RepID=A0A162K4N6_CORDF|nr:Cysteine, histidine-dependent amidohydrolase/peptidase [Akanthomyces lecanii RCEF 1005]
MKCSSIAQIAIAAIPVASGFAIRGDGVQCHTGPGADYASLRAYATEQDISLSCQAQLEDETWYKTSDNCFVSAAHVPHAPSSLAACDPSSEDDDYTSFLLELRAEDEAAAAAAIPGPVTNDYPYSGSCSGVDPWAFYKCECTSFVAFRVNKRLGVKFTNQYKGAHWGDAKIWDEAARQTKVRIDSKPVPGCVAQTNAGAGHVAWVTKVSGDKVTVEEYNYVHKKAYGTRTVAKSTFSYIHIKV